MKAPRAIVFDLDGTIADTRLNIAAACNHALAALGRPAKSVATISTYVGDGGHMLIARALELPRDDPRTEDAFAHFNVYYAAHAGDLSTCMPGALEALDACDSLSVLLALATNKPRTATLPLLDALGIERRFRSIVAGGDGPLKPDPAAILAALAPLGVAAEDAWVVGDGPQDIGAGNAAGAWTVAVLGGFADESALRGSGPDHVLGSLHELPALLTEARR